MICSGAEEPYQNFARPSDESSLSDQQVPLPQIEVACLPEIPHEHSTAGLLAGVVLQMEEVITHIYEGPGLEPAEIASLQAAIARIKPPPGEAHIHNLLTDIGHRLSGALQGAGVRYRDVELELAAIRNALRMDPRMQDREPLQLACMMMQSVIVEPRCSRSGRRMRLAELFISNAECPETEADNLRDLLKLVRLFRDDPSAARRTAALRHSLLLCDRLHLSGRRRCRLLTRYRYCLPL
ncbi:MAG: hypothetical protein Fues2KO_21140 [Fuerstiella sp.]